MSRAFYRLLTLVMVLSMLLGTTAMASPSPAPAAAPDAVTVTILHTNDFHGFLEPFTDIGYPGMARTAQVIETARAAAPGPVLLVDAGDFMQGGLLSNYYQGASTVDVFNQMGYAIGTFGNHEFDWGQQVLTDRINESQRPFVTANIVQNDTGSCATAGWTPPAFAQAWMTMTVGTAPNTAVIGFIGVTTQETPNITIASATQGLCFKDPADAIGHYYDELTAASDAIVVLTHLGMDDTLSGSTTYYGDKSLATKLNAAGHPVPLIIGGHSHTNLATPGTTVGTTVIGTARSAGRNVGKATLTIDPVSRAVTVAWERLVVDPAGTQNAATKAVIEEWASDPAYQAAVSEIIGYTNVPLTLNYNGDSVMGMFVNDAIYKDLNNDAEPLNDVDVVFNNPGGLRVPIDIPAGATLPYTLTHGMLYNVMPFGNKTVVGDMTGAQIVELLNQSASLAKGALQVSGVRYSFYSYKDALPGPQPWAWGAYDIRVKDRDSSIWQSLELDRVYRVGTNEFLAPAGGDSFTTFQYMTNIFVWTDMLDSVERYISANYTKTTPFNGARDGRINRDGTDAGGSVVPVTLLFHNDPHGNLLKSGTFTGLTQLATLVKEQRAHNPTRTLLFNAGDTIQGDAMSYYFKSAYTGFAADGTAIADPAMHIQPTIKAMNAMTYTAMVLGNHEFNFGKDVFTGVLSDANFSLLGANVYDDGTYGLETVGVQPHINVTLPGPSGVIDIALLGLSNHRVPNYELPSNIPGLTFTNPISEALARTPYLAGTNDIVVALTHIGFTTNPKSAEVDNNVDTYLASATAGIDAILGSHSHTDPTKQTDYSGAYKYLPAIVGGTDNEPVLIHQAYRYNTYLGQVVLGLLPIDARGAVDYQVVARAGRAIPVVAASTAEDATIKAIVQPYADMLAAYNATPLGQTTAPIDALAAFTQETTGANLQADASVWELEVHHGIPVDFHLSGAMTNKKVADAATPSAPVNLTVANMFTLMPYENSLVVLNMNGPELKAVLERSFRNYYYYKYYANAEPKYAGYSYYTTCFLDTNAGNEIVYRDGYPRLPNGNNVVSLTIGGVPVDFADATKYYKVSTVNYLAAGSCNYNDGGVTLWPLGPGDIVADTQYYVRDAVIYYIDAMNVISPAIEGRVQFMAYPIFYLPLVTRSYEP